MHVQREPNDVYLTCHANENPGAWVFERVRMKRHLTQIC
ncbi:hypothetical protein NOCARDAX2BIS_430012 [Nocardioides sp. AX2bis]|nr:hypothetical protein NOCARDAX2BIS_430012 [Nocardioides sp. AX2bis]